MGAITKQEALDNAAKAIKRAERAQTTVERQEQLNISDQWIRLSQAIYIPTNTFGTVPYTFTTTNEQPLEIKQ